jgi:hypothetical protein
MDASGNNLLAQLDVTERDIFYRKSYFKEIVLAQQELLYIHNFLLQKEQLNFPDLMPDDEKILSSVREKMTRILLKSDIGPLCFHETCKIIVYLIENYEELTWERKSESSETSSVSVIELLEFASSAIGLRRKPDEENAEDTSWKVAELEFLLVLLQSNFDLQTTLRVIHGMKWIYRVHLETLDKKNVELDIESPEVSMGVMPTIRNLFNLTYDLAQTYGIDPNELLAQAFLNTTSIKMYADRGDRIIQSLNRRFENGTTLISWTENAVAVLTVCAQALNLNKINKYQSMALIICQTLNNDALTTISEIFERWCTFENDEFKSGIVQAFLVNLNNLYPYGEKRF